MSQIVIIMCSKTLTRSQFSFGIQLFIGRKVVPVFFLQRLVGLHRWRKTSLRADPCLTYIFRRTGISKGSNLR